MSTHRKDDTDSTSATTRTHVSFLFPLFPDEGSHIPGYSMSAPCLTPRSRRILVMRKIAVLFPHFTRIISLLLPLCVPPPFASVTPDLVEAGAFCSPRTSRKSVFHHTHAVMLPSIYRLQYSVRAGR